VSDDDATVDRGGAEPGGRDKVTIRRSPASGALTGLLGTTAANALPAVDDTGLDVAGSPSGPLVLAECLIILAQESRLRRIWPERQPPTVTAHAVWTKARRSRPPNSSLPLRLFMNRVWAGFRYDAAREWSIILPASLHKRRCRRLWRRNEHDSRSQIEACERVSATRRHLRTPLIFLPRAIAPIRAGSLPDPGISWMVLASCKKPCRNHATMDV